MKIPIIIFSCLYSVLAITVHYETKSSLTKNTKQNQEPLKDIRLVAVDQSESLQKPIFVVGKETEEFKTVPGTRKDIKVNRPAQRFKYRGDKGKLAMERVGTAKQNIPFDQNHQNYMQKMANQLFMAQKHASLLSEYQKFILNQDPKVKDIVLGQSVQERNAKPIFRPKQSRALSTTPKYEPVTAATSALQKIVVVTPKLQSPPRQKSQLTKDHFAQAAQIKYVTLAPQSLTHLVQPHEPAPKVTLLPYHSSQPYAYYDLAVTGKPPTETVQIPSTLSLNLGSFEPSHYYNDDSGHEDSSHHESTKYEFMYKVKDHEKHNDFGHKESRNDKKTYGYYYVHLPDGRLETVRYWADKTGYHAKVDYHGEAKHPLHSEHKIHSNNFVNL